MIKRKCAWCKRYMQFKLGEHIKMFCSKECYDMDRQKRFASEDNGPPMKPLTAEDITDEGYIALVKAMVGRASQDVTHYKPGTQIRISAEQFFESDYFNALTGLDGKTILRKLQEESKRKQNPKRNNRMKTIRCVETGVEYESAAAAAAEYNTYPKNIWNALGNGTSTAVGMHWEYVEG